MEIEFKAGDIVKLKNGGPEMNVERTVETTEGPKVCCRWFIGSKPQEQHYKPEDLQHAARQ